MHQRLATNRHVLQGLHLIALVKGFLRHRNPRRREAGMHRHAFNEQAWREAAASLGATWRPLGSGFCEIALDGAHTRVVDNACAIDDPVTLRVLHDKPLTHRILRDAGVCVPRHATFTLNDLRPALALLRAADGGECVVKPAAGTGGGAGVATGIRTPWQLARAAAAAAVYADPLMIEHQVEGDNYRLLYLDGELLDAYVRRRPTVIADGRSTVATLVRRANEQRLARAGVAQQLLTVDLDMRRTLARQRLSLRSVPPAGTTVALKTAVNENAGADNSTATHLLCRAVVDECSRAVRALGARFAGVDVITRDPGIPLVAAGGAVLEVNGTPNLYFHYHKLDGSFPVAVHVLGRLLPSATRRGLTQPAPMQQSRNVPQEASSV